MTDLRCPSSLPWLDGAEVLGVLDVGFDGSRTVTYAETGIGALAAVDALPAGVEPEQVFRFHAACVPDLCSHYRESDDKCTLVERAVGMVVGLEVAPRCSIRKSCRWFAEQGVAACKVCPLVATLDSEPSADLAAASEPPR